MVRFLLFAIILLLLPCVCHAQAHGIESRAENTALIIDELHDEQPGMMRLQRAFPRLTFSNPIFLLTPPDGSPWVFVVQKNGLVLAFPQVADPAPSDVIQFLDIRSRVLNSGEQGL